VGPDAVVGAGAQVAAGVSVVESVVWPGAVIDRDARAEIITPPGVSVVESVVWPGAVIDRDARAEIITPTQRVPAYVR